jgi:hypothetical protein
LPKKHGTPQGFWQKIEQRLSMDFQPSASMTGIAILNQIKTSCSPLSGFSHLKINLIFNFFKLQMLTGTSTGFDLMSSHPMFVADQNIWLQIFPGHDHTGRNWINRIWNALEILSNKRN